VLPFYHGAQEESADREPPCDIVQALSGLQLAEPKYFDFEMKAPYKLYLGTIDIRGKGAFFVDLLIPTMTVNQILPTVLSCCRFFHISYKIPKEFARFDETKNVPENAVVGYCETISKIEDAYADLNKIMPDPPQVIGLLPCAINSQFCHRGIMLDIPTCPEVFEELSWNMHVRNGQGNEGKLHFLLIMPK
jgi:hypothetical protein